MDRQGELPMATVAWNGSTSSTDYNDLSNWVPAFVPGGSDTATFGTGTGTTVTDASGGVGAWQFTGGSYTVIIVGGVTFNGAGVQVTGGSARIELANITTLTFSGASDGGTAAYVLGDRKSVIEFTGAGPNGDNVVHLGSLAGYSAVELDSGQTLIVGANNLSTTFAGSIGVGGPGAALVKVGTGTW